MAHDFSINNMVVFKLSNNSTEYALHKHIAAKMDIFNALSDCSIATNVLEITWDIRPEIVTLALHCLNYYTTPENIVISTSNEIVLFLKYLGLDSSILDRIIRKIIRNIDIDQFINELINPSNYYQLIDPLNYDNLMFIFDRTDQFFLDYKAYNINTCTTFVSICDKILTSQLSKKNKLNVIKKIFVKNT